MSTNAAAPDAGRNNSQRAVESASLAKWMDALKTDAGERVRAIMNKNARGYGKKLDELLVDGKKFPFDKAAMAEINQMRAELANHAKQLERKKLAADLDTAAEIDKTRAELDKNNKLLNDAEMMLRELAGIEASRDKETRDREAAARFCVNERDRAYEQYQRRFGKGKEAAEKGALEFAKGMQ